MKKLFTLFVLFCFAAALPAQAIFQKAISIPFVNTPFPKSLVQCSDGGFLLTSTTYSSSFVTKTDAQGTVQWTKNLGTSDSPLHVLAAGESNTGGYYVFGDGYDATTQQTGFVISMLDASGNTTWTKIYPNSDPGYGYSKVRQLADGGFMISESFYSKMGALRTDASGNVTWHYSFTSDTSEMGKHPSFDCLVNNDGSMVFTGKRENDICLVKVDANGQSQWTRTLSNGFAYYHARGICPSGDGGYIVCGYEDYLPFLMKVDASGNTVWYKTYTSQSMMWMSPFEQVFLQPGGNILVLGADPWGGTFVALVAPTGSLISTNMFGSTSSSMMGGGALCPTSDGGFALATTYTDNSNGMTALTLMKTDASGLFPCNYTALSLTESSSVAAPSTLPVTIYRIPEANTSASLNYTFPAIQTYVTDFCLVFSVDETPAGGVGISAYPSPLDAASQPLRLRITGASDDVTIGIYDAEGRLVREVQQHLDVDSAPVTIAANDLPGGVYLVRVTGSDGSMLGVTKFIVR